MEEIYSRVGRSGLRRKSKERLDSNPLLACELRGGADRNPAAGRECELPAAGFPREIDAGGSAVILSGSERAALSLD